MDYPSIRGEDLPYYAKKSTWNLFHAYIDSHSQILNDKYPGDEVEEITRLQSQFENMTSYEQSIYSRLYQKVINKVGESVINCINILQNSKELEISVGNGYS